MRVGPPDAPPPPTLRWDLHHYFDRSVGPFRSLTDLDPAQADALQAEITRRGRSFAARRPPGYLDRRRELEALARRLFEAQGGRPLRAAPLTMCVGACAFLEAAYPDPGVVVVPVAAFDPATVSFTYGDLFPTFSPRVTDGREYRGRIYTLDGIVELLDRLGLPQEWNADGSRGPERYVEAQVWDDGPLRRRIA